MLKTRETRVEERKEEKRSEKRDRILRAAEAIFLDKGFHAASMNEIAEAPEFGRFRQTKSSQLFDYQRVQSFFKLLSCVHARACL